MDEILVSAYREAWELEGRIPKVSVVMECAQILVCSYIYSKGLDFEASDYECAILMEEVSPSNIESTLDSYRFTYQRDEDGRIVNSSQISLFEERRRIH